MFTTILLATLTGVSTGLVMAIPFVGTPTPSSALRKSLAASRAILFASLALFAGMLYSLSLGFVFAGLRAHAITGVVAYLTFAVAYVLIARGRVAQVKSALYAHGLRMIEASRCRSLRFDRFCLRIEASKREYQLIKARKALK